MKRFFLSLVVLVMATTSFAQSKLVATLTHGDNVKVFYGYEAFQSAYKVAQSGDVITLSGGTFYLDSVIRKAVTIRGVGIDSSLPTRITTMDRDMTINIPEIDTCKFSVEGVRFDKLLYLLGSCIEPYFLKSQFTSVDFYKKGEGFSHIKDALFVNCKFTENLSMGFSNDAKFSHCYVSNYDNWLSSSKIQFMNCVIRGRLDYFRHSSFINSILIDNNYGGSLPAETIAMNSVVIDNDEAFSLMQGSQISCSLLDDELELFKTYRGWGYDDSESFELTEAAAWKYLGTDGTQIGLYGGQYPYNSTPSYPRITKLNVAKQSTADDKLSVDIEVSAAE